MSGDRPDDVVFHLRFQAEIFDQVAVMSAMADFKPRARRCANDLRRQADRICADPPAAAAE